MRCTYLDTGPDSIRRYLASVSVLEAAPLTSDPIWLGPNDSVALALSAIGRAGVESVPILGEVCAGTVGAYNAYGGRRFLGFVHTGGILRWLAAAVAQLPSCASVSVAPRSQARRLSALSSAFVATRVADLPPCAARHAVVRGDLAMSALEAAAPLIDGRSDGVVSTVAIVGGDGELLHVVTSRELVSYIYNQRAAIGLIAPAPAPEVSHAAGRYRRRSSYGGWETLSTAMAHGRLNMPVEEVFTSTRHRALLISAAMPAWRAILTMNNAHRTSATLVDENGMPLTHFSASDLRGLLVIGASSARAFAQMQASHRANANAEEFTPSRTECVLVGAMGVNTSALAQPILELVSVVRRLTLEARVASLAVQPNDPLMLAFTKLASTGWGHVLVDDNPPWTISTEAVLAAMTLVTPEPPVSKGLLTMPIVVEGVTTVEAEVTRAA